MMRAWLIAVATVAFVAHPGAAVSKKVKRHPAGVSDQFIVVLPSSTPTSAVKGIAQSLSAKYGLTLKVVWPYSLKGFLCSGPSAAIDTMADDPRVQYAEQDVDGVITEPRTSGTQYTYYDPLCTPPGCTPNYQYLWFLDRLDEVSWASRDGFYNMCPEGRSVYAYIIDIGVWRDHPEFETPTRVVDQVDFSDDRSNLAVPFTADTTNGCHDTNGTTYTTFNPDRWHATAVAASLAGTHIGSSKTQVVSLKFARCVDGSFHDSSMISALDWIASPNNPYAGQPAVINQSSFVPSWDQTNFQAYGDAAARTVAALNIPFFTSANNYSTDACQFSPSDRAYTNNNHSGTTFSVGGTSVVPCRPGDPGYPNCPATSTDNNDYRFQYWDNDGTASIGTDSGSNGGACVSAYAPAVAIYGARLSPPPGGSAPYDIASGTSFSSPLVAGLAARYIEQQRNQTGQTPGYVQVYNFLLGLAVTPILFEQTAPTYWACVRKPIPNDDRFAFDAHKTNPGSCPAGFQLIQYNSVTNTSGARMIYWDPGCP